MLTIEWEAAEELVDGLIAAQLVEPGAVQGRYRLHDLLRLFGTEQLDQHEADADRETAWASLTEAAIGLAYAWGEALEPPALRPEQDPETYLAPDAALLWLEQNGTDWSR